MTGLEHALGRSLRWLIGGLLLVPPLLLVPTPNGSTGWILFHLGVVSAIGLALTMALHGYLATPWFGQLDPKRRHFASAASIVALVTGVVALVMLASAGALRLDPSLQFLQLLSALDIAWVVAATALGARLLRGPLAGWIAGSAILGLCVWSVASYLEAVGYTPSGGWLVDGPAMWRYILPFDIGAAMIAITTLTLGVRKVRSRASDDAFDSYHETTPVRPDTPIQ